MENTLYTYNEAKEENKIFDHSGAIGHPTEYKYYLANGVFYPHLNTRIVNAKKSYLLIERDSKVDIHPDLRNVAIWQNGGTTINNCLDLPDGDFENFRHLTVGSELFNAFLPIIQKSNQYYDMGTIFDTIEAMEKANQLQDELSLSEIKSLQEAAAQCSDDMMNSFAIQGAMDASSDPYTVSDMVRMIKFGDDYNEEIHDPVRTYTASEARQVLEDYQSNNPEH